MDRVGAYPNMSKKCFDVSYAQAKTYKEKTDIALERMYTAEAEIQRLIGLTKAQDDTIQEQEKLIESYKAELKAKDERIAELEARIQNMCAECECAKFADSAIKPSEMWKLHTILKDNK